MGHLTPTYTHLTPTYTHLTPTYTHLTPTQRFQNGFGAPLSRKPPKTTQNHPHRGSKTVSALPYLENHLKPLKTTHTEVPKRFRRSLILKTHYYLTHDTLLFI